MIRAILSRLWPRPTPSPADTILAVEQERDRLIQERSARVRFKAKRTDIDPALQKATTASLMAAVGWF